MDPVKEDMKLVGVREKDAYGRCGDPGRDYPKEKEKKIRQLADKTNCATHSSDVFCATVCETFV